MPQILNRLTLPRIAILTRHYFIVWSKLTPQTKKCDRGGSREKHKGSVWASQPVDSGLILDVPEKLNVAKIPQWCCSASMDRG